MATVLKIMCFVPSVMSGATQEPRLRAAAVVAGHRRREDDPQPLRLPQGLSAEEGICEV